jgi:hypothetical protein
MADIEVTPSGDRFHVVVRDGSTTTEHDVTVPPALVDRFGVEPARLVEASFAFLLEREPATSILRQFDLTVIGRYFPDYPDALDAHR